MPCKASIALLGALLVTTLPAPAPSQTGKLPPAAQQPPPEPAPRPMPEGYTRLPAQEAEAIREVIRGYAAAVQRSDGLAAAQAVTRGTRAYYARMRDLALTASETKTRGLPLMDRFSVLMYRHRVSPQVLRAISGDSAFAHTISEGWVAQTMGSGPIPTMGEVWGGGNRALIRDGATDIHLQREDGAWRWDMMPLIRIMSEQFAANLPGGMKEAEFIFYVLTYSNGQPVSSTIWQPAQ